MLIERQPVTELITCTLRRSRIVVLIGPRQCGKTTLARQFLPTTAVGYFDLEDPVSLARLNEPMTALRDLTGLIVIDEVQRRPDLFPILRVLVDRDPLPARFLILGSASPGLLRQSSESLAGRIEIVEMSGFSLREVGLASVNTHWLRGGFPLSFLAGSNEDSAAWRASFIQTFLERDLPQMGIGLAAPTLLRFWRMLAHYHGQIWNAAEFARSLGVNESTARRYLDALAGVLMVRPLQPFQASLKKRQVKSPKVYLRDSGLLHQLLGIRDERDLLTHPRCGASWEGYAIEETLRLAQPAEAYFWATHNGAELDLLMIKGGKRIGVECKRMDAPRFTASMRIALNDLALDRLVVLYPGDTSYSLDEKIIVEPLARLEELEFFT